MREENAYLFWERFDRVWSDVSKGRTIKELTLELGLKYDLIRTQRSRTIFPSLPVACKLAQGIGTTVEYLTTGKEVLSVNNDIIHALSRASTSDILLVRRALRLPDASAIKKEA